jgi:hypothetical protein
MQYIVTCWEGCGDDFVVNAPDRQDPALTDGVQVGCTHCGTPYTFTVDGDGEPSLDSLDDSLGQNIDGPNAADSTHY